MRLFFTGVLILFFWNIRSAMAQDEDWIPANRHLGSIRFTVLNGGIILGRGQIGDFPDSLNFIFDTGCGGLSLDSTTAERLKLVPEQSQLTIRGIGGSRQQRLLNGMSIHLGNITLDSLAIQVSNYEILSSVYGEPIDGIIGYTFFSRFLVKVDYDNSTIEIYSKGNVKYPKGGFLLKPRLT